MRSIDDIAKAFFHGCYEASFDGNITRAMALDIATSFVQELYPNSTCSFVFGSSITSSFKPYSDIDIIVIDEDSGRQLARRDVHCGYPIETHLFDRSSILLALRDMAQSGRINVSSGLYQCEIVHDTTGLGKDLSSLATNIMNGIPPQMSEAVLRQAYCSIISNLIELSQCQSKRERFAIIKELHRILLNLYLSINRKWVNSGKWAVRDAPTFASELNVALDTGYITGSVKDLISLIENTFPECFTATWSGTNSTGATL